MKFFTDCKVALVIQLEILKKKYSQHIFHKQDIYNSIYQLNEEYKSKNLDSELLLNTFFEKITQDPNWKMFI